jgi:hypothetical protein
VTAKAPLQGRAGTERSEPNAPDHPSWQATALSPNDNVAIALEPVAAGQDVVVSLGDRALTITSLEPLGLGHKIALVDLRPGDALIKYGECIGEATTSIARGAWVHVHNLTSRRARQDGATSAFDAHAYMQATAMALELSIPAASQATVAANLTCLHALAQEVLSFEIPQHSSGSDPDSQDVERQ